MTLFPIFNQIYLFQRTKNRIEFADGFLKERRRKMLIPRSNDGIRKRKQPYLAHMSQEAFRELKRQNKGAQLEKAIAQWIAEHDR